MVRLPFTDVVGVPVLRSERVRVHSPMECPLTLHLASSGHHPLRAAWSAAFVVDVVTGALPSGLPGPTGPCSRPPHRTFLPRDLQPPGNSDGASAPSNHA